MDLIFINGTMGAGKTATARALQKLLPPCVRADGDDLWDMYPFAPGEGAKELVLANCGQVLGNFLRSGLFESVVFSWVMHEESIVQDILARLPAGGYRFFLFTLECGEETLRARLQADCAAGLRSGGVRERSAERAAHYGAMPSHKLNTDGQTPEETAARILRIVRGQEPYLPFRRTRALGADGRALREEVFVAEQGFAEEFDAKDGEALHFVFYKDGVPAACCRLLRGEGGTFVLGRLAVKKPFRGGGVGAAAVRAAEDGARLCGGRAMVLSAQVRARPFYERCGYAAEGGPYEDEGVPHIRMHKAL